MDQRLSSYSTETWYPYSELETVYVVQDHEGIKGYFGDSENHLSNSLHTPRPVQTVTGS